MKPALIRYSEESGASPVCAYASGVPFNVIPNIAIRIPSRLSIYFSRPRVLILESFRRLSKSKPKRQTAVNRPLDLRRSGVYEIRNEFQMFVIQQVLAADRQFKRRNRPPAQMRVQRVIAGYV